MKLSKEAQNVIYAFSAIMLFLSLFTGDEPLTIFDAVGLCLAFGSRYLPGTAGRVLFVIGIVISFLVSIAALIALVLIIGIFSFLASHYVIIGVYI